MSPFVQNLNSLLGLGTILLQLAVVVLFILLFSGKGNAIKHFVGTYGILLAFLLALATMLMSLFYSDILGFTPCGLCWFQRIFLYPQVFILGIALVMKDRGVALYSIGLSAVGSLIALYQHYLQMGGSAFVSCPVAAEGADCARRILFEYGYVTFPLMSFSVFAALILIMLYVRRFGNTPRDGLFENF